MAYISLDKYNLCSISFVEYVVAYRSDRLLVIRPLRFNFSGVKVEYRRTSIVRFNCCLSGYIPRCIISNRVRISSPRKLVGLQPVLYVLLSSKGYLFRPILISLESLRTATAKPRMSTWVISPPKPNVTRSSPFV